MNNERKAKPLLDLAAGYRGEFLNMFTIMEGAEIDIVVRVKYDGDFNKYMRGKRTTGQIMNDFENVLRWANSKYPISFMEPMLNNMRLAVEDRHKFAHWIVKADENTIDNFDGNTICLYSWLDNSEQKCFYRKDRVQEIILVIEETLVLLSKIQQFLYPRLPLK
jgi:hypothetical protein